MVPKKSFLVREEFQKTSNNIVTMKFAMKTKKLQLSSIASIVGFFRESVS